MKQRPSLSSAFVHRSPISFHSFRTRHGVVNKDLVRDEALRPSPSPKKCCLTEDDQLGFLGNCLPTPPLSHR